MSNPLTDIVTGASKVVIFLIAVFTKTSAVTQQLSKLSPAVIAALLATFYDVVQAAQSAEAAIATGATGNIPSAYTLSETTLGLVKNVVAEAKADEALIVADLKSLGIVK